MNYKIPVEPIAKARARTAFKNGKVFSYTPTKTREYEDTLRLYLNNAGIPPYSEHEALSLEVTFYRTKSKEIPKNEDKPVRRPDLDNLVKSMLDALMPNIVPSDAQITTIVSHKRWTNEASGYILLSITPDIGT